ncbi:ERF family protein [Streptomyces sp. NBC_01217]|uniref:ERF family protein n=1 Tax=Streptomyces sp. NBC_01217 TaxID=2903779 RepID=UPI002E11D7BA|nr:ERF family protein [Streptomyces sp. NBC_01217]
MTVTTLPIPHATATAPAAPVASTIYQPAPAGTPADTPRVFAAIAAVMRDVMPVAKDKENQAQRYKFRGVDDAMSAMAGPMRAHGLFILPSIADHRAERRGDKMTHVTITMRYHVYGPAGDCLTAEVPGEASDFADKATNKAQSAALKYLLFTLFMIPVDGRSIDDGDRDHPVEPTEEHRAERAAQQQRRNQRQQNGQQRNQQRQGGQQQRPNRGEQQGPPAPAAPTRDYLAEATTAPNPQAFAKVRADAVAAGAPPEFLARLDAVAAQKKAAANQPQRQQAPAGGTTFVDPSVVVEDQEHAAALGEMYDAAKSAGLTREEADAVMVTHHKTAPQAATIAALRALRDDLLDAARQNGATA